MALLYCCVLSVNDEDDDVVNVSITALQYLGKIVGSAHTGYSHSRPIWPNNARLIPMH